MTPVKAGGLGLNASHYAELVAFMCFAQSAWSYTRLIGRSHPQRTVFWQFKAVSLWLPLVAEE